MSAEYREALCAYVAQTFGGHGRRTDPGQFLRERQVARVLASAERLDDEIYEAASSGATARASYLEWVREQVPYWLVEGEQRGRRRRAER